MAADFYGGKFEMQIPKEMKAVLVRAPMQFAVERVSTPDVPRGGLLLKVEACALCGSDMRTLRSGHRKVVFPWIIGHEICGRIAAVSPEYKGPWIVGDLLAVAPIVPCGECSFCRSGRHELCIAYKEIAQAWPGGFAEYLALPAEAAARGAIQKVPSDTDPVTAAISEPIASCVNAQEKGDIQPGESVVVIGAGPIGCIHAVLARARGASKIIIANRSPGRLRHAAAFHPDHLVDGTEGDIVEAVRKLTDGDGADVVISANPSAQSVVQAVEMARKGGRVLIFGGLPKDDCKPPVDMNIVHYNALSLIGTTALSPRHHAEAVRLALSGEVPVDKLVTHRLPLDDFEEGVRLTMSGEALKCAFLPGK